MRIYTKNSQAGKSQLLLGVSLVDDPFKANLLLLPCSKDEL